MTFSGSSYTMMNTVPLLIPDDQNTMNSMLHELLVSEDRDTLIKHPLDYSNKTDLSHRPQVVADLFKKICLKN